MRLPGFRNHAEGLSARAGHDRPALFTAVLLGTLGHEPVYRSPLVSGSGRRPQAEESGAEWEAHPRRITDSVLGGDASVSRAYARSDRMTPMLTLQRRHSLTCRNRNKSPGRKETRCRCPLWACGM